MSPEETCETSPLLGDSGLAGQSGRGSPSERFRPETLLIPVVFAKTLGSVIPSTTLFELSRQAVCRLSNVSQSSNLLAGGPSPPELCDAPEAVRYFATFTTILGVIGGIGSMVGCGVLSRISPRYGRKPVFLLILVMDITWSCLIPWSQLMPLGLSDRVYFLGILFHLLSGALPSGYLVNMYIVDVCVPEDRTAALSKMGGWGALGASIALALGGTITTKTGNPLIVFYIATAIFVFTFIYIISTLPETFPEEKRIAVHPDSSTHRTNTYLASLLQIFEPLKMLVPTGTISGTRNWRLTWCAAHCFMFVTSQPFASSAWLVLATSKFHLTPADNGIFFTVVTTSNMLVLAIIVPLLVRFLRPYYSRRSPRSTFADESRRGNAELEWETSDHMDVHLAFMSCVFKATFLLCSAAFTTKLTLIISAVFVGLGNMHTPTIRSLIAGSVDPLQQGDAMAAIEMVDSAGRVLSPIIMGSILSSTVDTAPQVLFYVQLAGVLISAGFLFLVRDADRFKPNEM